MDYGGSSAIQVQKVSNVAGTNNNVNGKDQYFSDEKETRLTNISMKSGNTDMSEKRNSDDLETQDQNHKIVADNDLQCCAANTLIPVLVPLFGLVFFFLR